MHKGPWEFLRYQTLRILKLGYQHPSHHAVVPPVHPQLNPDHITIKVKKKKKALPITTTGNSMHAPCSNAQSRTWMPQLLRSIHTVICIGFSVLHTHRCFIKAPVPQKVYCHFMMISNTGQLNTILHRISF